MAERPESPATRYSLFIAVSSRGRGGNLYRAACVEGEPPLSFYADPDPFGYDEDEDAFYFEATDDIAAAAHLAGMHPDGAKVTVDLDPSDREDAVVAPGP